ncbi:unnamed protein product [Sphagnum tenellum]
MTARAFVARGTRCQRLAPRFACSCANAGSLSSRHGTVQTSPHHAAFSAASSQVEKCRVMAEESTLPKVSLPSLTQVGPEGNLGST